MLMYWNFGLDCLDKGDLCVRIYFADCSRLNCCIDIKMYMALIGMFYRGSDK